LTFWSGDRIADRFAQEPKIVDPYNIGKIDCSAYTLTLGEQYFVTPNHDMKDRESIRQSLTAPTQQSSGGSVSIPAGQFAFLLTEEALAMPHNAMGFISMKAKFKFKGLINVSGFHVDPGFRGKLVFAVYNAGPSKVNLSRGDPLFLLWLADLDAAATEKFSRDTRPPLLEISNDIINGVNHPIHSLQILSKKIDEMEREHKFFKLAVYLIAAAITTVIAVAGFLLNANKSQPLTPMTANHQKTTQAEARTNPTPVKAGTTSVATPKKSPPDP
jgi:dCTP deaminase